LVATTGPLASLEFITLLFTFTKNKSLLYFSKPFLNGAPGEIANLLRKSPCGLRGFAATAFSPSVVSLRDPPSGPGSKSRPPGSKF
jgi:hypothetical protein